MCFPKQQYCKMSYSILSLRILMSLLRDLYRQTLQMLIQNVLMEKILEKLKEAYDVIIVDTPPIGLVTDARTIMHFADTSIYVLRSNYSKKEYFKNLNRLEKDNISNFSVLLNGVKSEDSGYGYSGYGYYEE